MLYEVGQSVGDLNREDGYPFFPSSSFLGRAFITYLNAAIVFRTNHLSAKIKAHLYGTSTAD